MDFAVLARTTVLVISLWGTLMEARPGGVHSIFVAARGANYQVKLGVVATKSVYHGGPLVSPTSGPEPHIQNLWSSLCLHQTRPGLKNSGVQQERRARPCRAPPWAEG